MQYFSYHTHSTFCDGKSSVETVCEQAVETGLTAIGFSSHAPVPFNTAWAMPFERLSDYVKEVERCKHKFADQLEVFLALEADFITTNKSVPFSTWQQLGQLDYIIGSVHLVNNPLKKDAIWFLDGPQEEYKQRIDACFDGDVRAGVSQYYRQLQDMILTQKPDVVAHMDKVVMNNKGRFFSERDAWYQQILEETLQVIAKENTIVEVNTRGIYRGKYHTWFPNADIINRCVELNIPLTVSVDAHHANELTAGFDDAIIGLKKAGCKLISVFEAGRWKQKLIDDVMS